jgi:D-alanyl-D-alanine carboxypeptidase
MGMASTTKIMTALIVAEMLPLKKEITIPPEAVNVEGSSVYLCEGEILTVEELLYALLLSSANDAATALAIATSGSIAAFCHKMNERARALGLYDTHFANPHGLSDSEHYTTAHDLALISAEALKNATIRRIASAKKATVPQGVTADSPEGSAQRYLYNHNKMLSRYKGAIGLKTGFTKATGRCLVSAAERDGLTLIAVTLDAPDDWRDHTALLDHGYSSYERTMLWDVGEFSYPYCLSGGKDSYVTLCNTLPVLLTLKKSGEEVEYRIEAYRHFEIAPVKKGKVLATLCVCANGRILKIPLACAYTAEALHK